MTARQLIEFLSGYDGETIVTMLQCTDDNPMCDDMMIKDVIAIERCNGETSIVIIPE